MYSHELPNSRRKLDKDGFCDCVCHDVKDVKHVMACCSKCGQLRTNPDKDRPLWGGKKKRA